MNDERVRKAHEAVIASLDAEIKRLQAEIEARRNIDGVSINWGHVVQLGGALEYVRDARRAVTGREALDG